MILPLMREGNERIFDSAKEFIATHHSDERLRCLRVRQVGEDLIERREGGKDYDEWKSMIGIAGQLQRSGKSNTAYINDCDYINIEKLRSHSSCSAIIEFFEDFIALT